MKLDEAMAVDAPKGGISGHFSVVYWCYSRDGDLLYIGCTGNPALRISYHKRLSGWFGKVGWIVQSKWMLRYDAFRVEANEIAERDPVFNVFHRRPKVAA